MAESKLVAPVGLPLDRVDGRLKGTGKAPPQHPFGPVDLPDRFARAMPALNNDDVPYFGFPVAFVVADTFEQATAAAAMVRVHYAPAPGAYDLHAAGPTRSEER